MSKTRIQADDIVAGFAGSKEHDKIRAARTFCNSDSSFLAWVKKATFSVDVIREARLIQQAWKTYGGARTILITLRAVKAALLKLMGAEAVGKMTKLVALALLESLGAATRAARSPGAALVAAPGQQELFA